MNSHRFACWFFCAAALTSALSAPTFAQVDGAAVYKTHCAACHDNSTVTRAPTLEGLHAMSAEDVVRSLESGAMKQQGSLLTDAERRTVAEFLTGKNGPEVAPSNVGMCPDPKAPFSLSGAAWNGWGADLSSTRFQPASQAGLTLSQVPQLRLKWAFRFPSTFVAYGQPAVVGGRVFVPAANRNVYALDARTGCIYWTFVSDAPSRTAISIAAVPGAMKRYLAFLGDQRGNAYGLDAATGELLWKAHVDSHPHAKIVGGLAYFEGRVFVPVTAGEEASAMDPEYECCSARGAMVALDAVTGKQIWKTYTISEEPHPVSKNSAGTQMWGPSGASIWSAPTIDTKKKLIYVGTGDNFSPPATDTSDAVIAFHMETGKIAWVKQLTPADVFNMACAAGPSKSNCPENVGPDFDIGASPILSKLANGKRVLLVSQKSGVACALDPDRNGDLLWQFRAGHGSALGGIQWGSATDGTKMYVALSDIGFLNREFTAGQKPVLDPKAGGGLFALDVATGKKVWAAPPPSCDDHLNCSPAQSAAISVIPGVVFSGSVDGHLRAYSASDGTVIWDFDTAREYKTVNGFTANGGSIDGPGPVIAGGMLYVDSGYGSFGGIPGNVLLAFSVDGE
jgi:polyvinyl alcohol dehydrogenase (cytochrome)